MGGPKEGILTAAWKDVFRRQLKHEICGKAVTVTADGLVKNLGWHLIEFCEFAVEHHLVSSTEIDSALNQLYENKGFGRYGRFLFCHWVTLGSLPGETGPNLGEHT